MTPELLTLAAHLQYPQFTLDAAAPPNHDLGTGRPSRARSDAYIKGSP